MLSSRNEEGDEGSEVDASDVDEDIKPLQLGADDLRSLLRGTAGGDGEVCDDAPQKRKRLRVKSHQESFRTVDALWSVSEGGANVVPGKDVGPHTVRLSARACGCSVQKRRRQGRGPPIFGQKTLPFAQFYDVAKISALDEWLKSLHNSGEPPTAQQEAFLASVLKRLVKEAEVERRGQSRSSDGEPLFDMVHGVPGAGRSKLIAWLRCAFEQVLGWVHGVQFACIAFQNAMAAHIGGFTIHHWTGIPAWH